MSNITNPEQALRVLASMTEPFFERKPSRADYRNADEALHFLAAYVQAHEQAASAVPNEEAPPTSEP